MKRTRAASRHAGFVLRAASLAALTVAVSAGCASAPSARDTRAACVASMESSRALVLAFYERALVQKQARAAFAQYAAADFVEHKPDVAGGSRDGAAAFLEDLIRELPDARWEVLRTVAENDLVFVHARFSPAPGAPPYAVADLFRVEGCAIAEHWDVIGPPREGAPNERSRF